MWQIMANLPFGGILALHISQSRYKPSILSASVETSSGQYFPLLLLVVLDTRYIIAVGYSLTSQKQYVNIYKGWEGRNKNTYSVQDQLKKQQHKQASWLRIAISKKVGLLQGLWLSGIQFGSVQHLVRMLRSSLLSYPHHFSWAVVSFCCGMWSP